MILYRPMKALLLLLLSLPGAAAETRWTGSLDQTYGSAGYAGGRARARLEVSREWTVQPSLSWYRSDDSGGTYKTLSLGAGYDEGPWSAFVEAGFSPRTAGYRKGFLYGEGLHSFYLDGEDSGGGDPSEPDLDAPIDEEVFAGLERVDLGAGAGFTRHVEAADIPLLPDDHRGGRTRPSAPSRELVIRQADLSAIAGAAFYGLELGLQATKSFYGDDLDAPGARSGRLAVLPGVSSLVQGFPKTSFNASLSADRLPVVPFVSYTHTSFELGAPAADAYLLGVRGRWKALRGKLAYERYVQAGYDAKDYVTAGVGLAF